MEKFKKYLPDRKFVAGGLSGILAWVLVTFVGIDDVETATAIVGGLMAAVYYLTPPSVDDILKRVDGKIIEAAKTLDKSKE